MILKTDETRLPSIEKPWLKYYAQEAPKISEVNLTVFQNILKQNEKHLSDTAIKYFGCRITYKKMFEQVEKCAKALKQAGVEKGTCINICAAGTPEIIELVLAANKLGAVANFINPLFETGQKIDRINETEGELLFVLDRMYPYIKEAVDKICSKKIIIIPAVNSLPIMVQWILEVKTKSEKDFKQAMHRSRFIKWNEFLKKGNRYSGSTEVCYQKNMPAIMVYSSGSTGASKGIVLTNDGINATIAHYLRPDFPHRRGETFLQMIPFWFSTGLVLSVLMPLCAGITVIPEPVFSKESFVEDIAKYKPNMTLTATSLWSYAIQSEKLEKVDLSGMHYPITGGEQILPETEESINRFLADHGCTSALIKGYGMCELGSTVTSTSRVHSKKGSVGYPISNVIVSAFIMETNQEVPYGVRGELRVNSPSHMKEYYRNPNATMDFFHEDEKGILWGCTGDIGYVDEEGDVFVLGRAADSYITAEGIRVYAFDAENVILEDKAVSMCKVVETTVEGHKVPVMHLILKEDAEETEKVIQRIRVKCQSRLASYAIPKYYKLHDGFPVHTNGKRDVEALKREKDGYCRL
ncbi:MAG: acyl--CoA ligase [Clostridiales bacterium]|nr:acyl--CoA ligase [Clostridiales bacterium]